MLKLKIISVGKTKEDWLEQALQEYIKRLKPTVSIEFIWAKNDEHLLTLVEKEPLYITLDANGTLFSSEEFAKYIHNKFEEGGSRLCMVIGGAEGLPAKLKDSKHVISLSPMTLTHQMVRLLLLEQIYRSFEIARGSKYHK